MFDLSLDVAAGINLDYIDHKLAARLTKFIRENNEDGDFIKFFGSILDWNWLRQPLTNY